MDENTTAVNPDAVYIEKYADHDSRALVKAMDEKRGHKDELEEALKGINAEYDYLRLKAIPQRFEADGIENLTITGIGRVSLTGDAYVQCPADKKNELHEYLRDVGKGSLIVEGVNAATLKALAKTMMKNGEELPPMIKFTPFTRATITKAGVSKASKSEE
jgi:hypothetical protein